MWQRLMWQRRQTIPLHQAIAESRRKKGQAVRRIFAAATNCGKIRAPPGDSGNHSMNLTQLLNSAQQGNKQALDELFPLVYDELRRVAEHQLRQERDGHTLQPTALVHEAYLRLIGQHSVDWRNRAHFFSIAAEMMRRILVNYAIERHAEKRGGHATKLALDEAVNFAEQREVDLVLLDEALTRLAVIDPTQSRIVELRFFGGLTIEEVAEVLELSDSTIKREWRVAKAWLYRQISGQSPDADGSPNSGLSR